MHEDFKALAKKADSAWYAYKRADHKWRSAAHALTGADWKILVDTIEDLEVKLLTACVVWWDFFGQRIVADRWDDLDEYRHQANKIHVPVFADNKQKKAYFEHKNSRLQAGLRAVGYPTHTAETRVKIKAAMPKHIPLHVTLD